MIHIKDGLYYKRRSDLEPKTIECIWIELINQHKHVLVGLFYRPPNPDSAYFSSLIVSFHLALDTGIKDINITGDVNSNLLNNQQSRKIA